MGNSAVGRSGSHRDTKFRWWRQPVFPCGLPSTSSSKEARVAAMTETEDENPRTRHVEDLMLSAIWTRLEQARDLATASDVMDVLPDVAALADEAAILARALELLRRAESER